MPEQLGEGQHDLLGDLHGDLHDDLHCAAGA